MICGDRKGEWLHCLFLLPGAILLFAQPWIALFLESSCICRSTLSGSRLFLSFRRFSFDKLEFPCVTGNQSAIQDNFHAESRQIDVPGFDEWVQKRNTIFARYVEDVRVQELQNAHAHRFVATAAESRYGLKPGFAFQFVFGDCLDYVQQLLCDEALEFAERLFLKDHPYLFLFPRCALAENQFSNFF